MLGELTGLASGEVHVYFAEIGVEPPARLREACARVLSPEERARYGRLVFERDRWPALLGRALLRYALSSYADVDPAAWRFRDLGRGKPGIAGPAGGPPLTFSVTNTPGLAACAVGLDREVGVDAEPIGRHGDLAAIAEEYLSVEERADVDRLLPDLRPRRLLEHWTLKEAYLKAVGVGLACPLRGVAFRLDRDGGAQVRIAPEIGHPPASWAFARAQPTPAHVLAAAAERRGGGATFLFGNGVGPLAPPVAGRIWRGISSRRTSTRPM